MSSSLAALSAVKARDNRKRRKVKADAEILKPSDAEDNDPEAQVCASMLIVIVANPPF